MTPGRESLRLADRDPGVRSTATREDGRFFSRRSPAAVDRIPFEEQRRGMEQVARRTFGEESTRNPTAAGVATPSIGRSDRTMGNEGDSGRGWRRVGEGQRTTTELPGRGSPAASSGAERTFENVGRGTDDGWRRFGLPRVESSGSGGVARENRAAQFGQPPATAESNGRGAERTQERSSDWRGVSGRSEASSATGNEARGTISRGSAERGSDDNWRRNASPRLEQPRSEQPRSERQGSPRMERRSDFGRGGGGGDSVRISPSIVRERVDRSSGGGGGGERSAPAMIRGADSGGASRGGGAGPARGSDGGSAGGGRGGGGGGGRGR